VIGQSGFNFSEYHAEYAADPKRYADGDFVVFGLTAAFSSNRSVHPVKDDYHMTTYGIVFPQTEIGADPSALRDYTQTVEALGYEYLLIYDHVLGANPERPGGWKGPYTFREQFHEPLTLFAWMSGFTTRLDFCTGILILPQRQTALVAKQATQVQLLSSGRLRLGVGIGWNTVEYEGLGQDFHTRGKRLEEQVTLLRRLWQEPLVRFEGQFDRIPDAGLNPLPSTPIPVWFGGDAPVAIERAARMGDGWIPNYLPLDQLAQQVAVVRGHVQAAGKDVDRYGIDVRVNMSRTPEAEWDAHVAELQRLRISHIALNTMGAGYTHVQEHLAAAERFKRLMV
jgi:probable F420-dependent oxidoreductase